MRRYGPPNDFVTIYLRSYRHYLRAAAEARSPILLADREVVMAALREGVPKYPEFRCTIRKLQSSA
jgi:hypothetical protein